MVLRFVPSTPPAWKDTQWLERRLAPPSFGKRRRYNAFLFDRVLPRIPFAGAGTIAAAMYSMSKPSRLLSNKRRRTKARAPMFFGSS